MRQVAIDERLRELGVALPPPSKPVAVYVPAVLNGNLLFISGQLPLLDGKLPENARLALGAAELPLGSPVEIELILEVR